MRKSLPKDFFEKPTLEIAKDLLGKYLVRNFNGKEISSMITEVEAYIGGEDKACHASCGKTKRNEVMFEDGGRWYVYLVYGMHWMLNIVTETKDHPSAVLIRGTDKAKGPARVTKLLRIDKRFNGLLAAKNSGLWIEDRGIKIKNRDIKKGPRIGVDYAGPVWSKKPWRFYLKESD